MLRPIEVHDVSSKRIYSEQEAAEVLQRAVRLQEASNKSGEYTPGITIEELKKIASEAGIDAGILEKALAGMGEDERSKLGLFNLTEEFERVVAGEMDPNDYDKILNLLKPGQRGMQQVGRSLSGQGTVGPHMVQLNVESRNGRTKVKVKYLPVFAYLLGLHGPVIGSFIALGLLSEKGLPLLGAAIAAGLLTAGSLAFRWLVKSGRAATRKLTGQIVEAIEEEVDPLRENLSGAKAIAQEHPEQVRQSERS